MANRYIEALYGDNPTQPRAEVYPSVIIIPIDLTIAADETVDVRKYARGIAPTTYTDIPIVTRYWLSYSFGCDQVEGGALIVRLTDDTLWLGGNRWNIFPIWGTPHFTNVSGIELPGGTVSFQIRNSDIVNAQIFTGDIILRAV